MATVSHKASSSNIATLGTSLIEMLDQWEVQMIVEFLSSFNVLLLRTSCAVSTTDIPIAVPAGNKHDPYWMICEAAKNGHRDLCILAREWISGASGTQKHPEVLCAPANAEFAGECYAFPGHKVPSPARMWFDAEGTRCVFDFNTMLWNAAHYGHRDICILAREWARETPPLIPLDINRMLSGAAGGADGARARDLCILARKMA